MQPFRSRPHLDKFARVYDDEILPIYGQRFLEMILRQVAPTPGASLLEVGCTTGDLALELVRVHDEASRVIAVDEFAGFIEAARQKLALQQNQIPRASQRLFFRSQSFLPRLPFAEEVYDTTVAHRAFEQTEDPAALMFELSRVTKTGGQVVITLPLAGTWQEVWDIFEEVLEKHGEPAQKAAFTRARGALPDGETVIRWLEAAGLTDVRSEIAQWELLFRSAREFFFAPVVEHGPLPRWKAIAGSGEAMHEIFFLLKEAIDTYFAGRAFPASILAGCFSGRKGTPP